MLSLLISSWNAFITHTWYLPTGYWMYLKTYILIRIRIALTSYLSLYKTWCKRLFSRKPRVSLPTDRAWWEQRNRKAGVKENKHWGIELSDYLRYLSFPAIRYVPCPHVLVCSPHSSLERHKFMLRTIMMNNQSRIR